MPLREERLEILRAETRELEKYLSDLPEEAWGLPSACDGWCIADVVAHLTLTRGFNPFRILRALRGDDSPADLSPRLVLGDVDPVSDAEEAITLRKELGGDLLAEYIKASRGIVNALANVGPRTGISACPARRGLNRSGISWTSSSENWPYTDGTFVPASNRKRACRPNPLP